MKSCYLQLWKAGLTVSQNTNHLFQLDIGITDNRNINARNLGNKGLHVNPASTSHLAKNLLGSIKRFLKAEGCPGILNVNNIEPEHSSVFDSAMPTSKNNSEDQPENRNLKPLTNIRRKNQKRLIIGQQTSILIEINSSFYVPK